jgi:polyhydroxybutyrate depolymerase
MLRKIILSLVAVSLLLSTVSLSAQDSAQTPMTCASAQSTEKSGLKAVVLESSGVKRNYLLYVPPSFDPDTPTPLILSFHGRSSNALQQSVLSNWDLLADKEGFLVAYPNALGNPTQWDTSLPTSRRPNEDLIFVSDLIDALSSQFCIDPARIYVNGMSNGGGMSNLLACALSDRIAAMGGVSGAYIGTEGQCNPPRPMPVIAFHGTADNIVTYEGGPSEAFDYPFPSVPGWAADWAAHNGCAAEPIDLPAEGDVSGIQYTECDENADVIFYTIDGGGHTWPGGFPLPEAITGKTSTDINATNTIWEFFVAHPMTSDN